MKTIEEFIREIEGSEALQKELEAITDKDAASAFLKKYDCDGSVEDFANALSGEGEITDENADAVAGGSFFSRKYHIPTPGDLLRAKETQQ